MSTHLEETTTTTTTTTMPVAATAPVEATPTMPAAATPALTISDIPAPVLTGPDSWDRAAKDLVGKLVADFGHPTEAIWLQADPSASDAAMNFDKALRAAMAMHLCPALQRGAVESRPLHAHDHAHVRPDQSR
jgi:hypothetical protein